jgi:hypothetical protein
MKRSLCMAAVLLVASPGGSRAQIDVAQLAEAYKAYDLTRNAGKGDSESTDSGTLGWGEGAVIQSYAQMWEATEDPYWLAKIGEHFQRIMDAASDPDGDGFLSWSTKTYSSAVAWAERLHNVSQADVEPAHQKNMNGPLALLGLDRIRPVGQFRLRRHQPRRVDHEPGGGGGPTRRPLHRSRDDADRQHLAQTDVERG